MKRLLSLGLLGALATLMVSCSSSSNLAQKQHQLFSQRTDYRKNHEVYRNEEVLAKANSSNTSVRIDLSDQRAQLLVTDGVQNLVAMDLPCCTGKAGKRTPAGVFAIKEKIVTKRSTIFGSLYRNGRKVYRGDRRKYRGRYDRYVGSALPYWMRLTNGGVGMHYSAYVHRYPGSNGCIRMPKPAVQTIFSKTKVGTPVHIVH
ncbi:L,D-transpeptidase [Verrucomicrobiaceae bacterium 5K15]|uniref:L,D-transpeptidase n=1 Tax=Oceaniferula flava TaxID=2800421 RepID=A0AAE2V8M5_9BACT|nr:L,D-transpeptidase [Oceaniferula flavus]MBK1855792.1 L,D-transpeptidase [Oceaniferula flavus]MBM1137099.1 L,D-transpeptidase [Oceaniferula flavus]